LDNLIDSSTNVISPSRSPTGPSTNISRNVLLITQKQLRRLIGFCRCAVTEIADSEQKQQLETHLRALIPLEDCLKNPPVVPPAATTNEENEHHHHHHHRLSHRRTTTNGPRVERLETTTPQHSAEVIVFTFESVENECPGMLAEEKVLQANERTKLLKTSSTNEFDPSATEKRLRFRLNDNCSVGNISDNLEGLEGISEGAASTGNLSVTSSCDDLDKATNEIETDAMFDNGSVSGRATPNLSGRDTPSSHISLDSTDRRTTSTNNPHPQDSVITNQSTTTNSMHNSLLAASQRGPVLPVVVQKPFRDDVPDKFNLFDLPQQRPTLEAGDETRSTISDNWSTMNAGVSEIDGQEQAAARLNEIVEELPIVEPRTRNELVLPENTSMNNANKPTDQQSDCWSTEAFASDSETHSEDGSNLQRLANQYQTASSLIIDEPLDEATPSRQGTLTAPPAKLADSVDILLMKSTLESLPSVSDSGVLLESNKSNPSVATPLKSPTDARSVHFPLIDLSNETTTTTTNLPIESSAIGGSTTSNSIIKSSSSTKFSEKRSSTMSAIRRRFIGNGNSSKNRDRNPPDDESSTTNENVTIQNEIVSPDDILARYSNKTSTSVENPPKTSDESTEPIGVDTLVDTLPYYDPTNLETCRAFVDAKKKLRIVLSSGHVDTNPNPNGNSNYLLVFLRAQLYEAIAVQDRDLQAQLHETLRSVQQFAEHETKEILRSMIDDYRSRSVYITYLLKNVENLLNITSHQDRLLLRIQRDQELCKQHLIHYLAKIFLDGKEESLQKLLEKFSQSHIADEKLRCIEIFLDNCYQEIRSDLHWKFASPEQFTMSQIAIERMVIAKIYTAALYPNGQADVQRDRIFSEHVRTLAEQLDPNHQKLRIQKLFQRECPWPSAQAELRLINAYKTPRDKVACVQRCIRIIQNLIRLASNSAAGADDTIPILIYVIVKENPPNLLSIRQYVDDLYSSRMTDEESYYWTMFVSGVTFIREMI